MGERACVGQGALMHAGEYENTRVRVRREAAAVALCRTCPVLDGCRAWVLGWDGGRTDPCPHSVVAAMTPAERRRLAAVPYRALVSA
jgi:hypothetical protein